MQARIQLVTIVGAAVLLLAVLEMVRRRRLIERSDLVLAFGAGLNRYTTTDGTRRVLTKNVSSSTPAASPTPITVPSNATPRSG